MTNQELLWRHLIERDMLEIMITEAASDEELLNLLLDRYNDVKRVIFQLKQKIKEDDDDANS
jgi:hypothetical protein